MTATSPSAASLPVLPVPPVPARRPGSQGSGPVAFTSGHHFGLAGEEDPGVLAARGVQAAARLAGKVAFVNAGFDGPRATFTRVRGDYDKALAGVKAFAAAGLPLSLSAVVLRSTVHALPYLCQIGDVLDAGKVKLILPLRKGNALGLAEREFITPGEAAEAFARLAELRAVHDWRPAIRLTPWTAATEGHMIVIEPDGTAQAWPVYDQPDLFLRLGSLLEEPITAIWDRYPYQGNHYAKYLGASILAAARSGGGG